ncbi:hypothetical protein [Anaerosolibacter sp.]|uniref:hypothetical protein n=1 Tax=Anaerosolibacter sp. TaxID=1872527 RepID=UPI0039F136CB
MLTLQQVRNLSEQQWDRLKEMIVLHTRLAKEYVSFPANGGDTEEEAKEISKRKAEIMQQIVNLRAERDHILEHACGGGQVWKSAM